MHLQGCCCGRRSSNADLPAVRMSGASGRRKAGQVTMPSVPLRSRNAPLCQKLGSCTASSGPDSPHKQKLTHSLILVNGKKLPQHLPGAWCPSYRTCRNWPIALYCSVRMSQPSPLSRDGYTYSITFFPGNDPGVIKICNCTDLERAVSSTFNIHTRQSSRTHLNR